MEAARKRPGRLGIGRLGTMGAILLAGMLLSQRPEEPLALPDPVGGLFPEPPAMSPPDHDTRLEEVTTRSGWRATRIVVTREELLTDPFLWNAMFFRDWDRVPQPLRVTGLTRMLARYGRYVDRPSRWVPMSPVDWDGVPQPVRAMAFMNMIARWEACLGVARRHGLERPALVARLRAVAMAESWFQHRARSENADGSTDLGLAQATSATRAILRARALAGLSSLLLEDEDYFDPLDATYVLVYWFDLMLYETGGEVDMATRAYHVGSGRARMGEGNTYLEGVTSIERRFIVGRSVSPTWRFIKANVPQGTLALPAQDETPACPRPDAVNIDRSPPAATRRASRTAEPRAPFHD